MSTRTNLMRLNHVMHPVEVRRACTAADTGDLSEYGERRTNDGLDKLLADMAASEPHATWDDMPKPEPLAIVGQGEDAREITDDDGDAFVPVIAAVFILAFGLAAYFGL